MNDKMIIFLSYDEDGQTGSGKTYTMGSFIKQSSLDEGIISRAFRYIFERMDTDFKGKEIKVRVSFLEIYNEEIRDLLQSDTETHNVT